ncbi:zf-HC2 domain-containing protein [Modicisalibacter tunisiensis]|uniref:Zf-HC2 domain-containing protein n=1 Tax=Modicisalibacter tunisiensis TaxID=390637 RepID=A0ABS7WXX1_9GAMM|nr:zf-HC2 domain-containing protein [Modicisalibacter tunisiensis]MBZ9566979.1 zf-HC2 domain-containing protein [Modicisalibacter tunisiensis]
MLMCREATRLMSKRLDTSLSFQERMSLKFHLAMCGACRNCNQQFQLLHGLGGVLEEKVRPASRDTGNNAE